MQRRPFLRTIAGGVTVGFAGCSASGLSDGEYDVGMYSNRFDPKRVEVSVGDSVAWGNTGSRPHTVTAYEDQLPAGATYFASGGFDSEQAARDGWFDGEGGVASGETYEHTFDTAGTFGYFCIPHEAADMVGTVVVDG